MNPNSADATAQPAKEHNSYTTRWDTIGGGRLDAGVVDTDAAVEGAHRPQDGGTYNHPRARKAARSIPGGAYQPPAPYRAPSCKAASLFPNGIRNGVTCPARLAHCAALANLLLTIFSAFWPACSDRACLLRTGGVAGPVEAGIRRTPTI